MSCFLDSFLFAFIKIVGTEVNILSNVVDNMVSNDENGVSHRDRRSFLPCRVAKRLNCVAR